MRFDARIWGSNAPRCFVALPNPAINFFNFKVIRATNHNPVWPCFQLEKDLKRIDLTPPVEPRDGPPIIQA